MTRLGVCPGSLSRITDLSQRASDGRKSEDGQFIAVEVLNIFGESNAAVEPGDCVLNYPAFWEDHEPFGLIRTFNNFCLESGGRSSRFEACACTPVPREAPPHLLHTYARKTGPATPPLHSWRNRSGKVEALLRRLAILGSGACCRGPAPGQRPKLYPSRPMFCRNAR